MAHPRGRDYPPPGLSGLIRSRLAKIIGKTGGVRTRLSSWWLKWLGVLSEAYFMLPTKPLLARPSNRGFAAGSSKFCQLFQPQAVGGQVAIATGAEGDSIFPPDGVLGSYEFLASRCITTCRTWAGKPRATTRYTAREAGYWDTDATGGPTCSHSRPRAPLRDRRCR